MFPEPFLWYPLIIDCIPQSCASPTANFQPPFFSAQIKNQCDLGNRFSNGESNLDSSLNIDIKYSFYVYRFGLFEQGIIWVYIYMSARIDLISSELWNGVWELGFRSCLVNAEKEAVQDTVRTYFIEHQHLHFFGLRSTCLFLQTWINMWSSIPFWFSHEFSLGISEQRMANAIGQHMQLHLWLRN